MTGRRSLPLVLALAVPSVFGACKDDDSDAVARLVEVHQVVEKQGTEAEQWKTAAPGQSFGHGSAVRTGPDSTARLELSRGGGDLNVEPSTIVRFQRTPKRKSDNIDVEAGSVEIEAGENNLALETDIGEAILEPNARVRIEAGDTGLRLSVDVGKITIEKLDGETVALGAGKQLEVDVGGAIVEPPEEPKPEPPKPTEVAEPPAKTVSVVVSGKGAELQSAGKWQPLGAGDHEVAGGARVRAKKGTKVEVVRSGARAVVSGKASFVVGGKGGAIVTASSGSVVAHADSSEAAVAVPGAVVVARPRDGGSVVATQIRKKGTTVEARRGEASIRSAAGEQQVRAGERVVVAESGAVEVKHPVPERADFTISAGESPVIHDASAPTALGVRFGGKCSGDGVLELARGKKFNKLLTYSSGGARANVFVPRGRHSYRVRCAANDKVVAKGRIVVTRDVGRKPLPKRPPRTVVDADGREYVVLYQNRLPNLTFLWRNAPRRSKYRFHIQKVGGKTRTHDTTRARLSMASGKLREGNYRWWVEIPETGGLSEKTRLVIDFDNAAPTVYFKKPRFRDGKVLVEGSVLEGTKISANGSPVRLDRHRRFAATLAPQTGETAVAVRIKHAKLRLHYYLFGVEP